MKKKIKIFCTLGPSSMPGKIITKLTNLGIDMFRINLSHTDLNNLANIISEIRKYTDKPICLDTEGAQVRIGYVENNKIYLEEDNIVEITKEKITGTPHKISFIADSVIEQIKPGDLINIDFESVLLQAIQCTPNLITAKVISGGHVGSNKAVTVDRQMKLPVISPKDKTAIQIGLKNGIRHFALSFAGNRDNVEYFRRIVGKNAHIISKIESKKGVENIDEILKVSDSILIDRGDLSREEPIEKIPFMQKLIIKKANTKKVPVYVATNLLESMVKSKTPTRAELNDIVNTLLDGADGLVLAAETAIGEYPVNCVVMISKTIKQFLNFSRRISLKELQKHDSFLLVEPHGGTLINRILDFPEIDKIKKYKILRVDRTVLSDAEQIGIGAFSPLQGFMAKKELESVLKDYKLPSGVLWPLPILLQVSKEEAQTLRNEHNVALALKGSDDIYAILRLQEIYSYDLNRLSLEIFGTNDPKHPGVNLLKKKGKYFLGGKIDLIKRLGSDHKYYEMMPKQARAIFENKDWSRVVGFHTRNVIHRVHEHIQRLALEKYHCDGIFVHPIVGPKKKGDYAEDIILKTYELMLNRFYPKEKAVLGVFQSYSRYAGPREAVFTALCRKNFGCSHFIVGRDHTGVGNYYKPYDVHELFNRLGDIGIVPIFFKEMVYCAICNEYIEKCKHEEKHTLRISGSKGREILESQQSPPEWFMRKEISNLILDDIKNGKRVFIT